jgi:hypothetical protein
MTGVGLALLEVLRPGPGRVYVHVRQKRRALEGCFQEAVVAFQGLFVDTQCAVAGVLRADANVVYV